LGRAADALGSLGPKACGRRSVIPPGTQTNGGCERFHKTVLNGFYRMAFRKKLYGSMDELQADLNVWVREYNEPRPNQGPLVLC
jgi:Integrase core domain